MCDSCLAAGARGKAINRPLYLPKRPTLVSMSMLLLLAARWCVLMMRCTMGISRPSVLNTTARRHNTWGDAVTTGLFVWCRSLCRADHCSRSALLAVGGQAGTCNSLKSGGATAQRRLLQAWVTRVAPQQRPRTDVACRWGPLGLVQEQDVAAIEAWLHAAAEHHHNLHGAARRRAEPSPFKATEAASQSSAAASRPSPATRCPCR